MPGSSLFGVADQARIVNGFARKADVRCGRNNLVPLRNEVRSHPALADLTLGLCHVIFVGEAAFGSGFDFQRISLSAMGRRNQIIMRGLGPAETRSTLCDIVGKPCGLTGFENFRRGLRIRKHGRGTINQAGKARIALGDGKKSRHDAPPSPSTKRNLGLPVRTVRAGSKPLRQLSGKAP